MKDAKNVDLKKINYNILVPEDIDIKCDFMDSDFHNGEAEEVSRNIVIVQKKINPKSWTPFSFQDYKKRCTHTVSYLEKEVLEVFVNGGRVSCSSTILSPGYLIRGKDGNYEITKKFLKVIAKFAKQNKLVGAPMELDIPCLYDIHDKKKGGTVPDFHPLSKEDIAELLRMAKNSKNPLATKIQVRLIQGIVGMTCPRPIRGKVSNKLDELEALYVAEYRNGDVPSTVDKLYEIMTR